MTQETQPGDKSAEAAKIVRKYMFGSVATAVLPLPLLDIAILGGIQLHMVRKLAAHYDVEFSEQRANAIIGSLAGVSFAMAAGSLLGGVFKIGRALLGFSALTLPAASTYAIGQVFIKHFESGGTFLNFDTSRAKEEYDEELESGKRIAAQQSFVGVRP